MATGKQSLRQKMINMMYLVLLAILALNVSAEVLKAFHMMEVSMHKTGETIDAKNNLVLQSFSHLMSTQPAKTAEWNTKALEGKKIADDFVAYIEKLKKELADMNGGRKIDELGKETEIVNSDNTEKHANYMLNLGKAAEVKKKINDARDKLLALVPQGDRKNIKTDLYTLDENGKTWEVINFEGVPIAAVEASLTKIQNDCKNTYADVLQVLYTKVGSDVPVDKLMAKVVPKTPFVMAGEKFEADVFLTAYDTRQPAEIVLNGKSYTAENGMLNYTTIASGQGQQTIKGVIKVQEREGLKEYPFETTYDVYSGLATVSADAMKVLYIGLDNPISISVPGVPTDNVIATISNGTLRKGTNNEYIARVNTKGNTTINVSVRNADGTVKSYGQHTFKAKNIPGASARWGSVKPGPESKSTLAIMDYLLAVPDFDIGFTNMTYKVTSYQCLIRKKNDIIGPLSVNSNVISSEIKNITNTLKKGDVVIFTNIKVQGPVGPITPPDISYTIK